MAVQPRRLLPSVGGWTAARNKPRLNPAGLCGIAAVIPPIIQVMVRTLLKLVFLAALVIGGTVGLYQYEKRTSVTVKLDEQIRKTKELEEVVTRLQTERRVADVIVTDQKEVNGVVQTTLLFVEYAKDGTTLPAKRFTFEGKHAHIDAMVVKFDGKYVQNRDPLRGQSIALFTRLFGDRQTPEGAFRIDDPSQIPTIYQGADPRVSDFEQNLWQDFWKLADDKSYRESMGVRIAQGEGVWSPFELGKLYTITLEADGGLNITSEPLKGIYSEALKSTPSADSRK